VREIPAKFSPFSFSSGISEFERKPGMKAESLDCCVYRVEWKGRTISDRSGVRLARRPIVRDLPPKGGADRDQIEVDERGREG
jgi:hypothetical protein